MRTNRLRSGLQGSQSLNQKSKTMKRAVLCTMKTLDFMEKKNTDHNLRVWGGKTSSIIPKNPARKQTLSPGLPTKISASSSSGPRRPRRRSPPRLGWIWSFWPFLVFFCGLFLLQRGSEFGLFFFTGKRKGSFFYADF